MLFPEGDFYQVQNNPMGEWTGIESPARYADFTEFGIYINRRYYGTMIAACKRHFRRMLRNLPFDGPRPHRHGRNHLYHGRNLVRALQVRNAYCSGHGGHANRQQRMRSCS